MPRGSRTNSSSMRNLFVLEVVLAFLVGPAVLVLLIALIVFVVIVVFVILVLLVLVALVLIVLVVLWQS